MPTLVPSLFVGATLGACFKSLRASVGGEKLRDDKRNHVHIMLRYTTSRYASFPPYAVVNERAQ